MHDVRDTWEVYVRGINDAIKDKAVKAGIAKNDYYEFAEFDILDTYLTGTATICYHCKKGLKCPRHAFARENVL